MLVAWDTAEFAFQPVRRPMLTEALVFTVELLVLFALPMVLSSSRRAPVWAAVANTPQFVFGVVGVIGSPANQGFGKLGPGIAALRTFAAAALCVGAFRKEHGS